MDTAYLGFMFALSFAFNTFCFVQLAKKLEEIEAQIKPKEKRVA